MSKVTMSIEIITPEVAGDILEANTKNRTVKSTLVKSYSGMMRRGEWNFNGDSIRISVTGILLDGQHRLLSVVISGVPLRTIVVRGLEDSSFDTIDSGSKRTNGDVFSIKGEKSSNVLAASLNYLYYYLETGSPVGASSKHKCSAVMAAKLLFENPKLRNSVSYSDKNKWLRKFVGPSAAAFCHYVFKEEFGLISDDFFDSLSCGYNVEVGSSIIPLRERLISNKYSRDKMTKTLRLALIFKAFKKFKGNEKIKKLRISINAKNQISRDIFDLTVDR